MTTAVGGPGGGGDLSKPLKPHHINSHYHFNHNRGGGGLHSVQQQPTAVQSQIKTVSSPLVDTLNSIQASNASQQVVR